MSDWECGIGGCEEVFETVESAIVHQTTQHRRHECKICGTIVPDGYLAIRHAFTEHSRTEYIRAYDTGTTAVREREAIKEKVEAEADLDRVIQQIGSSSE